MTNWQNLIQQVPRDLSQFSEQLFWLSATVISFWLGQLLYRRLGQPTLLLPIVTSLFLMIGLLFVTATEYIEYFQSTQLLHFMLAPAVVMLAVPMYQHLAMLRQDWYRIVAAVTAGSLTTVICAVILCEILLTPLEVTLSMWVKSVTTPVAITLVSELGGVAALASAFVMVTGVFGAVIIPPLLTLLRLDHPAATGLTLGTCAHAVGTSRALELGPQQTAYASLAMTLTACLHAVLLPWLV